MLANDVQALGKEKYVNIEVVTDINKEEENTHKEVNTKLKLCKINSIKF